MAAANLHCSPRNHVEVLKEDGEEAPFTCYTMKQLRLIAQKYNQLNPNEIIKVKGLKKKELHDRIKEALSDVCKNEFCWSNQVHMQDLKDNFRPVKPLEWEKNRYTWLNTNDILKVMKQYEHLHTDFKFLGVFPIDFTNSSPGGICYGEEMCSFEVNKFLAGRKKQFAFVLNLDRHDGPGSHWVSVYCNLDPKKENLGIYYYDSTASRPGDYARNFMDKVAGHSRAGGGGGGKKGPREFEKKHNTIQKQFKNTECGMFSMIFITQCLKRVYKFEDICQRMPRDDEVNQIREIVYLPRIKTR